MVKEYNAEVVKIRCAFCEEKTELQSIKDLLGEVHTYDYDKDGKLFKICPSCLTVDSLSLRGTREVLKEQKNLKSGYVSNRRKREIANYCAVRYNRGFTEMRKIADDFRDIDNLSRFIDAFAHKTKLSSLQVLICANNGNNGNGNNGHKRKNQRFSPMGFS